MILRSKLSDRGGRKKQIFNYIIAGHLKSSFKEPLHITSLRYLQRKVANDNKLNLPFFEKLTMLLQNIFHITDFMIRNIWFLWSRPETKFLLAYLEYQNQLS